MQGPGGLSLRARLLDESLGRLADEPHNAHVGRQLQIFGQRGANPMLDGSRHQVPIDGAAQVPWLVKDTGGVLTRIGSITPFPASDYLGLDPSYRRAKLALVVERGNHHMAPLVSCLVIAVMPDDEPLYGVIPWIYLAHMPTLVPRAILASFIPAGS